MYAHSKPQNILIAICGILCMDIGHLFMAELVLLSFALMPITQCYITL